MRNEFLTGGTFIRILVSYHLDFCIMCVQVSRVTLLCGDSLPITIPMTIVIALILTFHSFAVGTFFLSPRNRNVHDVYGASILINPNNMKTQ